MLHGHLFTHACPLGWGVTLAPLATFSSWNLPLFRALWGAERPHSTAPSSAVARVLVFCSGRDKFPQSSRHKTARVYQLPVLCVRSPDGAGLASPLWNLVRPKSGCGLCLEARGQPASRLTPFVGRIPFLLADVRGPCLLAGCQQGPLSVPRHHGSSERATAQSSVPPARGSSAFHGLPC